MTAILVAAVVGVLVVQAPAKPADFNGVWVLDVKRSTRMNSSGPEFELSVADTGKRVEVVQRFKTSNPKAPGGIASLTYSGTTDGKPSVDSVAIAGIGHSRLLAREGKDLVWRITMTRTSDGAATVYTERWSVSDGGKTLTIHRIYRNGLAVTEVFARKG